MKNIGQRIQTIRQSKGYSLNEFADKLSISYKKLEKIEKGTLLPDLLFIKKICDRYCSSVNELLNNKVYENDDNIFGYLVSLYEVQRKKNIVMLIVMVSLIIIVLILICELIII